MRGLVGFLLFFVLLSGCSSGVDGEMYEGALVRAADAEAEVRVLQAEIGDLREMYEGALVRAADAEAEVTVTPITTYDREVRNNFLFECQYASEASYCERTLVCIEQQLPQSEFEYEGNLLVLTGELSDRMADVMARCASS